MTQDATKTSQRVAARIAGSALLLIIVSGVVGTIIGRDHIEIAGDAVATAQNILAQQTRFRIGTAFEIVMLNCDVVLAVALYILLKPDFGKRSRPSVECRFSRSPTPQEKDA
jgi:Domain of unknown function (DUF4386)